MLTRHRILPPPFQVLASLCVVLFCAGALQGEVSTNGLMARYLLDGDVADASGHGYEGTVYSATPASGGIQGGCYEFNGAAAAVVVNNADLKNQFPSASPITISAWVKVRAYHSSITVIAALDSGRGVQTRASLRLNEFGVPYFYSRSNDATPLYSLLGPISSNQWHLVTGVQTGSVARLYIDGQLAAENAAFQPLQPPSSDMFRAVYSPPYADISVSASIGAWTDWWGAPESTFNGWIDDVRFYNRGLSSAEIEELWSGVSTSRSISIVNARGAAVPPSGVYTYEPGTTVSASVPASVVAGSTQYVCAGATVVGNDATPAGLTGVGLTLTNNATVTWNWQTRFRLSTATVGNGALTAADGWYDSGSQVVLTATPADGSHLSQWAGDVAGCVLAGNVITASMTQARSITAVFASDQLNLADGLVAYYPLDNSLLDYSGNNYSASNFSALSSTNGCCSGCYEFNGASTAIVVYDPALDSRFPAGGSITISAWAKPRAFNSSGITVIAAMDCGRGIQTRASIRLDAAGVPYFYNRGDDAKHLTSTLGALTTNQWHLVTGVQSGTVASLYVDGQLAATTSTFPLLLAPYSTAMRAVYSPPYADISVSASIGAWTDWWGASESTFNGWIDDVRFYDRALSASEALSLFNPNARRVVLTVAGGDDRASPTNGVYVLQAGAPVTARVTSPLVNGTTQSVCLGASVLGNTVTSGDATNVCLTITNDTVLTWNWQSRYLLTAAAGTGGTVSGSGWHAAADSVTLCATPETGYRFAGWSDGDTNATRVVVMPAAPMNCTATFALIPRGTLRIQKAAYNVGEGQNTVKITVERIGGSYGAVSVNYALVDGTAQAGEDYACEGDTLSWTNGQTTSKYFYVDILPDEVYEPNETFTVNLYNVVGADLGSPCSATVTIVDNDSQPTKLPRFVGSLDFGSVPTNAVAVRTVTVWNDGNQPLAVTGISLPAGFAAAPTSFSVSAAESMLVEVSFTPTTTNACSGLLTLVSDATGGTSSLAVSGTGVEPPPPAGMRTIQGLTAILAVTATNNAPCLGVEDVLAPGMGVVSVSDGGTWDAINRKVKWFFNEPGQIRDRALQYTVSCAGTVVTGQVNTGSGNQPITGATTFTDGAGPGLLHPADANGDWRLSMEEVAASVARWRAGVGWDKLPVVVRGITLYLTGEAYYYDAAEPAEAKRWKTLVGDASPKAVKSAGAAPVVKLAESQYGAVRSVQTTNVTIAVTPPADVFAWGMEESIPEGLQVVAVNNEGSWDSSRRRVKWTFPDGTPRTLSYSVAGSPGTYAVVGQASFDGSDEAVAGAGCVGVPLPFETWAAAHGVSGTPAAAFQAWNATYRQPNAIVYALQYSLQPGDEALLVRMVNGVPLIEVPLPDPAAAPYVDVRVEGTTNLASGAWSLSLTPSDDQSGMAGNRRRWQPVGAPGAACFRLTVTPR
jgi:hypothetical protein